MKTLRLLLIGFGSVHQHLARILPTREDLLRERYGLHLPVVGVADSGGGVYQARGLDLAQLLAHKQRGHSVYTFSGGEPVPDALTLAQTADYDVLLEASPVNLQNGEPGLSCVRAALVRSRACVLANKAPLVLDYPGLQQLARTHGGHLSFSATVCGGLPVINVGQRDLIGAEIRRIEGVFNSTSNYILSRMADGEPFSVALAEAQRRGIAEADPSLDVDGWDTATKLVILANAVLHTPITLNDVSIQGIRQIRPAQIGEAYRTREVYKLVASAVNTKQGYQFSVGPKPVPERSFLGELWGWQMGIVFYTDLYEEIYMKVDEKGPGATTAAMLRDVVNILNFRIELGTGGMQ